MISVPTTYGFQMGTRQRPTLILDAHTGSLFAFSLKKLSNSYTGDCCVVRRSSDDAEQTIGFRGDGWIDIDALETFVGASNDGFVSKWFDQSGNGYHATSSANSKQLRLVDNGTIHSSSLGAPYMMSVDATGNQHLIITAALNLETGKRHCAIHIGSMLTTGGSGRVRAWLSQYDTVNFIHAYGDVNSSTGHFDGSWRYTNTVKSTATLESWAVHRYSDTTFRLMRDKYSNGQNSAMTNVTRVAADIYIAGFWDPDATSRRYQIYSELIHWNDTEKSQTELESMFSYMNKYLSGSG